MSEDTGGIGGLHTLVPRKDTVLLYILEGWLQFRNLGKVGTLGSRSNFAGEGTGGRGGLCAHVLGTQHSAVLKRIWYVV